MNGNKLYRSTSEAIIGGVASGLGNYLKIDPILVRIGFVVATIFTGGFAILAYLALWLFVPTAGSTAPTPGDVMRENLDDFGARVRGTFSGTGAGTAPTNGGNGAPNGAPNGGQNVQFHTGARSGYGILPIVLIGLGIFFLLTKIGFFHFFGPIFWPIVLIGFGLYLLSRRRA